MPTQNPLRQNLIGQLIKKADLPPSIATGMFNYLARIKPSWPLQSIAQAVLELAPQVSRWTIGNEFKQFIRYHEAFTRIGAVDTITNAIEIVNDGGLKRHYKKVKENPMSSASYLRLLERVTQYL